MACYPWQPGSTGGERSAHCAAFCHSSFPVAAASPSTIKGLSAGWNTNINIIANQQHRSCTTRRLAENQPKRSGAFVNFFTTGSLMIHVGVGRRNKEAGKTES